MKTKEKIVQDINIITLLELSLTAEYTNELKQYLLGLIQAGKRKIIIDLSWVHFIDSTGIACLMHINHTLNQKSDYFALCNPQESVIHILDLAHLRNVFQCFGSENEAVLASSTKQPQKT